IGLSRTAAEHQATPWPSDGSARPTGGLVWRMASVLPRLAGAGRRGRRDDRACDHKAPFRGGQMTGGWEVVAMSAARVRRALTPARGEPYPARPVKIIVPTPAGGPVDVIGRLLANHLSTASGQAVVVDNRPGAGNTIGSKEAALAEPDGYT